MSDKTYFRIVKFVFALNVLFLIWAILWKCGMPFIGDDTQRAINLLPFHGNTGWEMQFNVLLFIPFGFLLSAAMIKRVPLQIVVVVFASVFLEITQYILAVGRSDITDIILNSLGGAVGIGAYYLLTRLSGKHSRSVVMAAFVLIALFEIYVSASFILFGAVRFGNITFKL